MPWSDNSGNRGPTRGPWGQQPRPPGGGNNNGGGRGDPPDLEELLKASRQRLKRAFPRGGGGGDGGGPRAPRLSRGTALIAGAAGLGLWIFSGFYQVDADELAVVTTFGRYDAITTPGLHWHFPVPIQQARTEKVTSLRPTIIPETGTRRTDEGGGLMLTGDKNIVDVAMQVQWRIKSDTVAAEGATLPPVAQFIFNIDDPLRVVRTVGEAAIREIVGRHELDYIQTEGRSEIQEQTRVLMQEALDIYNTGIEVAEVNLEKADPPTDEVNAAFLDVIAASQDRNTIINGARAYANRVVPEARGEAQRILEGARAYQAQVTAEARGQAARFDSILTEYQRAPDVTRQRMYLETIERVLGPMNKVIVENEAAGGVVPYLPLSQLPRQQTGNQ